MSPIKIQVIDGENPHVHRFTSYLMDLKKQRQNDAREIESERPIFFEEIVENIRRDQRTRSMEFPPGLFSPVGVRRDENLDEA